MKGIKEPITSFYGVFVWSPILCLLIAAFFWMGEGVDPGLTDQFGENGVKALVYNGYIQNVIAGLPNGHLRL